MDDAGANLRVCAPGLISFGARRRYAGPVLTARAEGDGILRLRDILDQPGDGRVLIADGRACPSWALLGDMLAARAVAGGWAGIILNGYVRDVHALRQLDIGLHALGAVPSRPKWPASPRHLLNEALAFQNCSFTPGSWVYADEDGILVAARRLAMLAAQ